MGKTFSKDKLIVFYGVLLAAILLLLKWLEFRFLIVNHAFEIYIGAIALIFTSLGIFLAIKLAKPKTRTIVVEKEIFLIKPTENIIPQDKTLSKIGISKREWEVLVLMSEGLSNQEIAGRLFVSLNTIKTHSSNIFEKLEVKRRTQAVEKGKRLGILA
jgi:NarL family two-component system response regulator LiaR